MSLKDTPEFIPFPRLHDSIFEEDGNQSIGGKLDWDQLKLNPHRDHSEVGDPSYHRYARLTPLDSTTTTVGFICMTITIPHRKSIEIVAVIVI